MKTAFIFPGQGSQKSQMGMEIITHSAESRSILEQAEQVLDFDVTDILTEEPATRIHETRYTQPLLLMVSTAIAHALHEEGIYPDVVAGLSLGEYSALVEAGALNYQEALRLVAIRGQLMQEAATAQEGSMAAVLGLDDAVVEDVCAAVSTQEAIIVPANYNTPGQLVIGGHLPALQVASEELKNKGAKRIVPLTVSGAFHTPLMSSAQQQFASVLAKVSFQASNIPVLSNTLGKVHDSTVEREVLASQITHAVKWKQNVEWMLEQGVRIFVEVGPGKSLSQMIKQIAKAQDIEVEVYPTETLKQLEQTITRLKEREGETDEI